MTNICAAIVILAIGLVACALAHYGWKRIALLVTVVLADVVLLVPVSSHEFSSGPVIGAFQTAYNVIAMLLFESRIDAFAEHMPLGSTAVYLGFLQVLYILTFVLFASLAYSLVTKRFAEIWLRLNVRLFCLCGRCRLGRDRRVYLFDGLV